MEENKAVTPTKPNFKPEAITNPFQLAAAVLLVIVSVDASFFFAASRLATPPWMPSFLVVSAVLVTAGTLFGVYRMATERRPLMRPWPHRLPR